MTSHLYNHLSWTCVWIRYMPGKTSIAHLHPQKLNLHGWSLQPSRYIWHAALHTCTCSFSPSVFSESDPVSLPISSDERPPFFISAHSHSCYLAFLCFLMPVVRYPVTANWIFFSVSAFTQINSSFKCLTDLWNCLRKKKKKRGWAQNFHIQKQDLKMQLYLFCPYCSDLWNSQLPELKH